MKRSIYHIIRLALAILPVLLTVASATAQMRTVYQGETTELSIIQEGNDTYTWELYNDPNVNFATVDGNALPDEAEFVGSNTGAMVNVRWLKAGVYFYRVLAVDEEGCTNNLKVGRLQVLEDPPTAEMILFENEICISDPAIITVTLTGHPAWSFVLEAIGEDDVIETKEYKNIGEEDSPYTYEIHVSPYQTTTYRIIKLKDRYGENLEASDTIQLTVHPIPVNSRIYQVEN